MAETDNIASLAEIVSNDLFARFFWGRTGVLESELASGGDQLVELLDLVAELDR